ncbi:MAG: DoxX family protein [Cyclobacteriaceae bacterium]
MIKRLIFETSDSSAPVLLRIMLGLVLLPHGAQKLFGWFGGYGFTGTMGFFTEVMGLPWLVGFLVIVLETIGALLLIAGFATRLLAIAITFLAMGIMFTSHIQNGFFMNWFGNQQGEGIEYFLLWLSISVALILTGGGKYSIDKQLKLT